MPLRDRHPIRVYRSGSGPAVVLLHGLGSTHRAWDRLARLAHGFEHVSYDLTGHGETPLPNGTFGIDDLSDELAAIMTEAGIARAHIVGTSLGGMIAQSFAAAYPGRVDRLVLCDTTPGLSEAARDDLLTMPGAGPVHAAMAQADLMDLAEDIFAPTLVLCAEGADLAMREGTDFLARSIPRGQFAFVPGAAADAVTDRPDWIARVLQDFLR